MEPSVTQWKHLYEAAAGFKRAGCWDWMTSGHLFGVANPANGEIGYCSIMGNGGEMFGMAVYLGTEGLETFVGMLTDSLGEDPLYAQYCLMLSFDDRKELYPQELKQIKELGLSFRGAKSWPTFRFYEPGFLPMPLASGEQVDFLTLALQQALEVARSYRDDPDALLEGEGESILTRTALPSAGGLDWASEWLEPKPVEESSIPTAEPVDELRLAKIKRKLQGRAGVWEIDCFYLPMPIKEKGERPYYPMACLIVDQGTGQILSFEFIEKSEIANKTAALFLNVVEQIGVLPDEIWAVNERVFMYMSQMLHAFDLQAFMTLELPALQEAKEGMIQYFENGNG
ncbi:DUF7309 domain-containing protein [Paenibacillus piri]|uniref:Uncharacterized protein n=1 Tax=Paenibacillus piri TaxID=2547395 RepID=A0A4R5KWW1_9BACL|nr:hypothetical protein [Paenibacillus piri]TDG00532.1 hypothetical protein E1757_02550 [Paenibacillus piri]